MLSASDFDDIFGWAPVVRPARAASAPIATAPTISAAAPVFGACADELGTAMSVQPVVFAPRRRVRQAVLA